MIETEILLAEGLSRLVARAQMSGAPEGTIAAALMRAAATLMDGRTVLRADTILAAVRAERQRRKDAAQ